METELLSAWNTVASVLLAILILLAMITVHEFGHYVAGKIFKFKIDEFSIGFGPACVKVHRKKSGELFAIRLFPLGGYCAFHGEDGLEEGDEDAADKAAKEGGEAPAREGQKRGADEPEIFKNDETLLILPPPQAAEERSGDAETTGENAGEERFSQEEKSAAATSPAEQKKRDWNDDGTFTHMKPWKRIIVLVAGALMNYLLALFLIILCFGIYGQNVVELYAVAEGETAYSFCAGDRILEADGRRIYLSSDLARALNGCKTGDEMGFLVSRVQEDGSRKEVQITVRLRGEVSLKNSADFTGVWSALGADIETREDGRYYTVRTAAYRRGFFGTLGDSVVYSFKIAGSIFRVIGELFTGRLGLNVLGGPVTTIRTTASVASQSFRSFLEIAGFIGVNLAVFNLLPIPALDGSKVVFCAIEWARGRPISRKIEAIIHAVGFVLLIGFAILVDVLQFI